jgi:molecular chaperone GrpE
MGKKRSESREVPIKFVGRSEKMIEEQAAPALEHDRDEAPATAETEVEASEAETIQPTETSDPDPDAERGMAQPDWQGQIDALTQERSALYDQLLRRQAEFENFRKRTERDREETRQRARADVMIELLPVVDNLERALSSLAGNNVADADALSRGIELIYRQFTDTLLRLGLKSVEAVGEKFDPNVHEAVASEPSEDHKENTIIEEFQRGYKLGDRLLRPAKVKVASGPER